MKISWYKKIAEMFVIAVLFIGLSTIGFAEKVAPPQKTLKIGCIMPLTGPYGFYGVALEPGIQIYADLLNEDGGVKIGDETYKIEMVFVDDACDPKKGPIAAQELLRKGCVANIGCFSVTAPIGAVLTPAKVLFVGQMQQGFDLKKHPYFIGGQDEWRPGLYAVYAFLEMWPDVKTIGCLWYDWQKIQTERIVSELQKPGTPVSKKGIKIFKELQTMGDLDFTTPLTKLEKQGADLIFCGFGPGDYAMVAKLAKEQGYDFKYYDGGTATDIEEFINMAGYDAAQGMTFNWPCPWAMKKSKIEPELLKMALRIKDRYQKQYGKPMTYIGGFDWGINHLRILLAFYQQAGTLDPDKVMAKVRGGRVADFTGTWTMGGEKSWGSPVVKPSAVVIGVIKGREVVYGNEAVMPTIP